MKMKTTDVSFIAFLGTAQNMLKKERGHFSLFQLLTDLFSGDFADCKVCRSKRCECESF